MLCIHLWCTLSLLGDYQSSDVTIKIMPVKRSGEVPYLSEKKDQSWKGNGAWAWDTIRFKMTLFPSVCILYLK